jgi:hypothetical protein
MNKRSNKYVEFARSVTDEEISILSAEAAASCIKLLISHDHVGNFAPFGSKAANVYNVWTLRKQPKSHRAKSRLRLMQGLGIATYALDGIYFHDAASKQTLRHLIKE